MLRLRASTDNSHQRRKSELFDDLDDLVLNHCVSESAGFDEYFFEIQPKESLKFEIPSCSLPSSDPDDSLEILKSQAIIGKTQVLSKNPGRKRRHFLRDQSKDRGDSDTGLSFNSSKRIRMPLSSEDEHTLTDIQSPSPIPTQAQTPTPAYKVQTHTQAQTQGPDQGLTLTLTDIIKSETAPGSDALYFNDRLMCLISDKTVTSRLSLYDFELPPKDSKEYFDMIQKFKQSDNDRRVFNTNISSLFDRMRRIEEKVPFFRPEYLCIKALDHVLGQLSEILGISSLKDMIREDEAEFDYSNHHNMPEDFAALLLKKPIDDFNRDQSIPDKYYLAGHDLRFYAGFQYLRIQKPCHEAIITDYDEETKQFIEGSYLTYNQIDHTLLTEMRNKSSLASFHRLLFQNGLSIDDASSSEFNLYLTKCPYNQRDDLPYSRDELDIYGRKIEVNSKFPKLTGPDIDTIQKDLIRKEKELKIVNFLRKQRRVKSSTTSGDLSSDSKEASIMSSNLTSSSKDSEIFEPEENNFEKKETYVEGSKLFVFKGSGYREYHLFDTTKLGDCEIFDGKLYLYKDQQQEEDSRKQQEKEKCRQQEEENRKQQEEEKQKQKEIERRVRHKQRKKDKERIEGHKKSKREKQEQRQKEFEQHERTLKQNFEEDVVSLSSTPFEASKVLSDASAASHTDATLSEIYSSGGSFSSSSTSEGPSSAAAPASDTLVADSPAAVSKHDSTKMSTLVLIPQKKLMKVTFDVGLSSDDKPTERQTKKKPDKALIKSSIYEEIITTASSEKVLRGSSSKESVEEISSDNTSFEEKQSLILSKVSTTTSISAEESKPRVTTDKTHRDNKSLSPVKVKLDWSTNKRIQNQALEKGEEQISFLFSAKTDHQESPQTQKVSNENSSKALSDLVHDENTAPNEVLQIKNSCDQRKKHSNRNLPTDSLLQGKRLDQVDLEKIFGKRKSKSEKKSKEKTSYDANSSDVTAGKQSKEPDNGNETESDEALANKKAPQIQCLEGDSSPGGPSNKISQATLIPKNSEARVEVNGGSSEKFKSVLRTSRHNREILSKNVDTINHCDRQLTLRSLMSPKQLTLRLKDKVVGIFSSDGFGSGNISKANTTYKTPESYKIEKSTYSSSAIVPTFRFDIEALSVISREIVSGNITEDEIETSNEDSYIDQQQQQQQLPEIKPHAAARVRINKHSSLLVFDRDETCQLPPNIRPQTKESMNRYKQIRPVLKVKSNRNMQNEISIIKRQDRMDPEDLKNELRSCCAPDIVAYIRTRGLQLQTYYENNPRPSCNASSD